MPRSARGGAVLAAVLGCLSACGERTEGGGDGAATLTSQKGSVAGARSSALATKAAPEPSVFALLARDSIAVRVDARVSGGDVGVSGQVGLLPRTAAVVVEERAEVAVAHRIAAESVLIERRSVVGDLSTDKLTDRGATHGAVIPFDGVAAGPSMPATDPGTETLTVARGTERVICPGSYGEVIVRHGATLRLIGGAYDLLSLRVHAGGRIEALGPVMVRIAGKLDAHERSYVGPAPGSGLTAKGVRVAVLGAAARCARDEDDGESDEDGGERHRAGAAAVIGAKSEVRALMAVPSGILVLGPKARATGAFFAASIEIRPHAVVAFEDGFATWESAIPTACDDGNACTIDTCSAGACQYASASVASSCSDGNACDGVETCDGTGVCRPGAPPLVEDGNPCTADSCDPTLGAQHVPVPVGTSCSDGNACTGEEACDGSGVCLTGASPIVDDGNSCTADSCDPLVGVVHVPMSAGASCADGDTCNGIEVCDGGGVCLVGIPPVLDDANACTADACDPVLGVVHAPLLAGSSCSDSDVCNGVETCNGVGICLAGTSLAVDDDNPCSADACDPVRGVTHAPVSAGTGCSDGNACNGLETCNGGGTCVAGGPPAVDDGNPCTIDSCDAARGVVHTPAPGISCSDGDACNGAEICNGAGSCVANTPPSVDDGDACTADACIPSVGVVHSPIPACGELPPDPATVAPPNDPTVATDIAKATAFLYTGSNPIQTDVPDGMIESQRVAVIRGHVSERDGSPIGGVKITVMAHPEFGSTLTRADGMFDMAVNGGGLLTVNYQKDGYLPAQRQVRAPWRDYVSVDEVVLVPFDTQVTAVTAGAAMMQAARGSPVTDADGARQATLLFPAGTQATMRLQDGSTVQLGTFHVRATEYTVGPEGPKAMPATLPPTSGYTYAVELSVDEAVMTGATTVQFDRPVAFYVENFLGFPVGGIVPTGYYDRTKGVWMPSDNGKVVKILSVTGGVADLDTNGDGAADDAAMLAALGVTDEERARLGATYAPGASLWRVPITHFSPWDCNWPYGCEGGPASCPPPTPPPTPPPPPDDPCKQSGSIIECETQVLGERIPITGTNLALRYSSRRARGYAVERKVVIPLVGATYTSGLDSVNLTVDVAGQHHAFTFPASPNLKYTFGWDGKDVYGRDVIGSAEAKIGISYLYRPVYLQPAALAASFGAFSAAGASVGRSGVGGRLDTFRVIVPIQYTAMLHGTQSAFSPVAGWSLNIHHAYDVGGRRLLLGDGSQRSPAVVMGAEVITTVAGREGYGYSGDGGPATVASLYFPADVAVGADGSLFIAELYNNRIRRVAPDGIITTVVGTGSNVDYGDGGPATEAGIYAPDAVAIAPDGTLFITTRGHRIRRVGLDGIITTIAGAGTAGFSGDGGPATSARLNYPWSVAVGTDGALFIVDGYNHRIRRVGLDGIITTIAGTGTPGYGGDGGPATLAMLRDPSAVVVGADGALFIADSSNYRIRRVGPDGVITTVAGTGTSGDSGDGGPATSARLNYPSGVAVGADGALFIADWRRIRRVGPDGVITRVAGTGTWGYSGDGGPATAAMISSASGVAIGGDGALFMADFSNHRIRVVRSVLPGFSLGDFAVASEEGGEVFLFNSSGRHLRTLDPRTHAVIYAFGYDGAGRLASVTDRDGLVTTIERVGGVATAIVAPHGQRTALTADGNGYLATITNLAGESSNYSYDANGLMQTFTDPRGNVHTFHYDDLGRLSRDEDPAGGSKQLSRTDRSGGYSVSVTTALGRSTLHDVKNLGTGDQVRTLTQPDGTATVSTEYTSGTKRGASPDGTTTSTTFGPDPQFGMQSPLVSWSQTTTPAGLARSTSQTASVVLTDPANVLSVKTRADRFTVNGRTSTSAYDAASRAVTTTTAGGRKMVAVLDATGRIASLQPTGVPSVTFGRDAIGQLRTVTQGARSTSIDYDTAGLPWRLTDTLGRQVQFQYDAAGRVLSQTLPGGRVVGMSYDRSGNLNSLTPPGEPAHGFASDSMDRLATYAPPLVPGAGSTTYSYDLDGALSQVLLPDSTTIVPGYDTAGRLATVTTARGVTGVGYDTAGRVQSLGTPEGNWLIFGYDGFLPTSETATGFAPGLITRTFDNDFRVAGVSVNGTAVASFQYDPDSLLTKAGALSIPRDATTGRVSSTTLGTVTTTPGYSAYGELASLSASSSGSAVYAFTLNRDVAGRISGKTETLQGTTSTYVYGYDDAGRLTSVAKDGALVESYWYDDNGNRLSGTNSAGNASGTFDAQDRMTAYGAATYTYGPSGDLRTKTASGQTTTYSYDSLGNLMGAWMPDGRVIEYVVDGLNRRVGKRVNGTLVEGFLYDGKLRAIAWLDASGAVKATFVYGLGVNVPEYMTTASGTFRIITDHLGSPRLVVDTSSGAAVQRMDYDSYGQVLADTNPGFQPFGFAGGLWDRDPGLVRFGARDYDPSVGRWTNKDPIRFSGGLNLYAYVENDPVNLTDPDGRVPQWMKALSIWLKLLTGEEGPPDPPAPEPPARTCPGGGKPPPPPPPPPWKVPLYPWIILDPSLYPPEVMGPPNPYGGA
jgi:RHS repeat-associated protein